MSEENVVFTEVEDGVLIVTMNRPEAKNAMSKAWPKGSARRWTGSKPKPICVARS